MVKEGYKQTEIGVIPEDWEIDNFSNVGEFFKGSGISMRDVKVTGFPCIMYGDIYVKFDTHFKECDFRIDEITAKKSTKAKKNDLFFTASGETAEDIGKCVSYQGDGDIYIGGDIIAIRPNSDYCSLFLAYAQNSLPLIRQKVSVAQGHTVVHIKKENIERIIFSHPKLDEQKRIAEALSDVDDMISSLEKLIEKKKAIKQGAMQDLLTGKKRLPGFTGDWIKCELDLVSTILNGDRGVNYPKDTEMKDYGIPFVNAGHIKNNAIDFNNMNYISYEHYQRLSGAKLKVNDILFCLRGSLGKYAMVEQNGGAPASSLCVIRTKNTLNAKYLFQLLGTNMLQSQVANANSGSSQPNISANNIKYFEIYIPENIKEQTAIVSILSDMDSEIEELEQKLNKTRKLKQGMMQQLLTGKIRLV